MAKGATAKANVEKKIKEAFGADYVDTVDKKIYLWADDGGERVQVCLALTCPKVFVGENKPTSNGLDFENMEMASTTSNGFQPAQITEEETNNVKKMLERLGL